MSGEYDPSVGAYLGSIAHSLERLHYDLERLAMAEERRNELVVIDMDKRDQMWDADMRQRREQYERAFPEKLPDVDPMTSVLQTIAALEEADPRDPDGGIERERAADAVIAEILRRIGAEEPLCMVCDQPEFSRRHLMPRECGWSKCKPKRHHTFVPEETPE